MGIPDHLTCLLRNLYAGQEATVRTRHGKMGRFQIWKGVHQAADCHPANLTSMQSISCKMQGWMKHKLESRWQGEKSITSDTQMAPDTSLMAESKEELKSLLMKVKEESEAGLTLSIQKTKIMASGSITSWQIHGETMETVTDFIFLGSKITADGDCSYEIKRCLLLGRKAMTSLDSILKSRAITLPTKVHVSQTYGFLSSHVWM